MPSDFQQAWAEVGRAMTRLAHGLDVSTAFNHVRQGQIEAARATLARLPDADLRRAMGAADTMAQLAEQVRAERADGPAE